MPHTVNIPLPLSEAVNIGFYDDKPRLLVIKGLTDVCQVIANSFYAEERRYVNLLLTMHGRTTAQGLCYRHDLECLPEDQQPWFPLSDVMEYLQPWSAAMGFNECCVIDQAGHDHRYYAVELEAKAADVETSVLLPSGLLTLKNEPEAEWSCDLSACLQTTFDEYELENLMRVAHTRMLKGESVALSLDLDDSLLLYRQSVQRQISGVESATLLHPYVVRLLANITELADKYCSDASGLTLSLYTNRVLPAGFTQVEIDTALSQLVRNVKHYKHPLLADPCSVLSIVKTLCLELPETMARHFVEPSCRHLAGARLTKCEAFERYYAGDVVGVKRADECRLLVDDSARQIDAMHDCANEALIARGIQFYGLRVRPALLDVALVGKALSACVTKLRDHRAARSLANASGRSASAEPHAADVNVTKDLVVKTL